MQRYKEYLIIPNVLTTYFPKNTEIFLLVLSGLAQNLLVLKWEIRKKKKGWRFSPSAFQLNMIVELVSQESPS